jgi:hypothetical protein
MRHVSYVKVIIIIISLLLPANSYSFWGFFGHRNITRLAVFSLPGDMFPFFRSEIQRLSRISVRPDQRRYAVSWEGPRHFLDMDAYADSVLLKWKRDPAFADSIPTKLRMEHGMLPHQVLVHKNLLTRAMIQRDGDKILQWAAEISHYIADAHVPLHTTSNYDGQQTGQHGIHGLWESRLPELHYTSYSLYARKARYIERPYESIWRILEESHAAKDSVLAIEKHLSDRMYITTMSHDQRGRNTTRQFSKEYASAYARALNGMVERRMLASIETVADFWYTCWIDAGMPDLNSIGVQPDSAVVDTIEKYSGHRTLIHK